MPKISEEFKDEWKKKYSINISYFDDSRVDYAEIINDPTISEVIRETIREIHNL